MFGPKPRPPGYQRPDDGSERGDLHLGGPKGGLSWGLRLGFLATSHIEIGGLLHEQSSSIQLGGTSTVNIGDERIHNYHAYLAYNFGSPTAAVRPYLLGGFGATAYGPVRATVGTQEKDIVSTTEFSSTWAAGVRVYPHKNVGFRLEGRWTPNMDYGWWCNSDSGCYVVLNSRGQYSNQIEVAVGLGIRF
jgi:opacity protein-like surface antigen